MNTVDIYLESINEGKIWDKVKKAWTDHKGKIIAGTAVAAAAYGANKYRTNPKRIATNKAAKEKKTTEDNATVTRLRAKDARTKERNNKIGAAVHAGGAVVKTVTAPARWVAGKVAGAASDAVKSVGRSVGNTITQGAKDSYDRVRLRDRLK